ncbi:glycine zipper 2TM domain-containing protein [Lysobacter humi (ex Lee et al. 2017)]
MKHLTASVLALGLVAASGAVSAQTYLEPRGTYSATDQYDWARVLRVQPVYDPRGGYASRTSDRNCTQSRTYAGGYHDRYDDRYGRDPYADRYGDRYANDRYNDRYDRGYGGYGGGTQVGGTVASVIGGIVGAAVGSQAGGGSARYATSAIGSMVGSIAGRQVYEQTQRSRQQRVGVATVCDPLPVNQYGSSGSGTMYDVTYEYGGRTYTTRTGYHPGERIRVRVDVRPE